MERVFITLILSCAIVHAAVVDIPADAGIQAAVDASPAGTTFQLAAGVYHMQTVIPKDGDQFIGVLDDAGNRLTTLTGAQPLTSFTQDGFGNYAATTTQTQPGQQAGFCAVGYPNCTLPEDFFYDNQPYFNSTVGGAGLAPGQYYFDYPNGTIYFKPRNSADDPAQHTVEYSRIPLAIWGTAVNVTVQNLIVEKYAVPDQFGALGGQFPGDGWLLQNNETRWNHGGGLRVPGNGQALNNYTHDNGQLGMGGSGSNILVQGNEMARNNYTGVDHNFECGGMKFAGTDGLTARNNYVHDNAGPGMWTDVSSIRVLYENNLVMNNAGAGIFHETSYDAVIHGNWVENNGVLQPDDWFWDSAIQIAASRNVEAYGNVVLVNSENNGNGIMLIQQDRSSEPCLYGPCVVVNDYVHDNLVIVTGTRWHGSSGGVQDYAGQSDLFAAASNNQFSGNRYCVTDINSAAYWQWGGDYQTFDGFQLFGLEATGTLSPDFAPAQSAGRGSLRGGASGLQIASEPGCPAAACRSTLSAAGYSTCGRTQ